MGKLKSFFKKCEIKFDKKTQLLLLLLLIVIIVALVLSFVLNANKNNNTEKSDNNVYLKEEVCFADEIYFSVDSINVLKTDTNGEIDEDGDELSEYILNLGVNIEQRNVDKHVNKVKISPSCFKLKNVNLKAKSKMSVFLECLAKETLSIIAGGAIGGSINIIEETINYAADYTLSSIENATNSQIDFKPIKCSDDSFDVFYPYQIEGKTHINLSFPIKQDYLESENVIVLAIDDVLHLEKRIFLIVRPT